ncbi:MAG TPA: hypothetical protein VES39_08100 [Rhodospirillales bacterium]|nr:hypothetical protein [Rhodospirillales bacterium]
MAMILGRITAPHFVAGLEAGEEPPHVVRRAAPIIAYMLGWTAERVADYCSRKRWQIERVREAAR